MKNVKTQIDIQHTTDDVEQYFSVIASLIGKSIVREGEHYKITKSADQSKKLYLRIGQIHVN